MENNKNKKTGKQNPETGYIPADGDFQRVEKDMDRSKSEKKELERRKQRIHKASTTPDKNHIG